MEHPVCCSCYYPPPMRTPCSSRKTFTLTLEPIVCVYVAVHVIIYRLVYGIFEYKTCVTSGNISAALFSEMISNGTISPVCRENEVEKFFLYFQLIQSACSILPCMFLGSWSDIYGRITLLILPVVGTAVMSCVLMVCVLIDAASPMTTLLSAIPLGLSGGLPLFILSTCCYSCDISEICVRTARICIIYTMGLLGASLGLLMGGTIHDLLGYIPFPKVIATICGCSAVLNLLMLTYIKLVVVETVPGVDVCDGLGAADGSQARCPWLKMFCPENVVRMWKSVLKPRVCDARKIITTLNVVFLLFVIGQYGTNSTTRRYLSHLAYNRAEINALNDLAYLIKIIGVLLMSAFMWKYDMKETTLGLTGSFLGTVGSLMLAIKGFKLEVIGVLVYEFSMFIPLAIVSILSKLVDTKETGSLFSALVLIECIIPPCASLLYRSIVPLSSSASMTWISFVMSIWIFFLTLVGFGYIRQKMPPDYIDYPDFSERLPLLSRRNISKGAIM